MNIMFVLYHDFSTSSAIHVHNFANLLEQEGHRCAVAVPENKESIQVYITDDIFYRPCTFEETLDGTNSWFADNELDIIHAWTPREIVRKHCVRLQDRYPGSKLVIHLEDNEEMIVETFTRVPYQYLKRLSEKRLRYILPDLLSSPYCYPLFLEEADAITVITDALFEFVPENKTSYRLWPVIDLNRFSPKVGGKKVLEQLNLSVDDFVLCYVGSVHGVNAAEVRSLYLAVYLANRIGIPARLIRAGRDVVDFLGDCTSELQQYVVNLGYVEMKDVPGLMASADLLVQPGRDDRFNKYRLPSKIPEFLAVGKPVAVPRANIGLILQDGEDSLIMKKGDAGSIVEAISKIYYDNKLGKRIADRGRTFAEKNFSQEEILDQLIAFYHDVMAIP